MIEAVENHMPQVIIIDEIGTELEVLAARTIAEKGVQLVGTTHGNSLENLIKNPSLADLLGGIQYVTLSDEEAKRRGTQKSILERKAYPAFELVIELNQSNSWTIHENVTSSVDLALRNKFEGEQIRQFTTAEKVKINYQKYSNSSKFFETNYSNSKEHLQRNEQTWFTVNEFHNQFSTQLPSKTLFIYSYSLSNNFLKEAFNKAGIKFTLTKDIKKASLIIGLKKHLRQNFKLKELAMQKRIPIYSLNELSMYQFLKLVKSFNYTSTDTADFATTPTANV
jgi:hypothetical protein